MADKITQTNRLVIELTNSEDKLKKLTVLNPDSSKLDETTIKSALRPLIEDVGILDETSDEDFTMDAVTTAYQERIRKVELDIR